MKESRVFATRAVNAATAATLVAANVFVASPKPR
jgi:hypothetical protein